MEPIVNYKGFKRLFYAPTQKDSSSAERPPVFTVTEQNIVVFAHCESRDFSEWYGLPFEQFKTIHASESFIAIDRKTLDQWNQKIEGQTSLYHESTTLALLAGQNSDLRKKSALFNSSSNHFLINALQSWWKRLLPPTYGILLIPDSDHPHPSLAPLYIEFKEGKIFRFFTPELRQKKNTPLQEITENLSQHYLHPVITIRFQAAEWQEWSTNPSPWKQIRESIQNKKTELWPYSLSLRTLIKLKK